MREYIPYWICLQAVFFRFYVRVNLTVLFFRTLRLKNTL